jgi:hypothetical protein
MHDSPDAVTYAEMAKAFDTLERSEVSAHPQLQERLALTRAVLEEVLAGRGEPDEFLFDQIEEDAVTVPAHEAARLKAIMGEIGHDLSA